MSGEVVSWLVNDSAFTSEAEAIEEIQQWGPSGSIAIPLVKASDLDALQAKLDAVTKDALAKLQQAADSLRPPERLTELRAEYWKAGAVAAIEAMNAALTGVAIGESHE